MRVPRCRGSLFSTAVIDLTDAIVISKWSIAEGAAYCHATTMTVEEFFDLGAAFGLQTRTTTVDGGEWASETGELLFFKVGFIFFELYIPFRKATSERIASNSDSDGLLQIGKRRRAAPQGRCGH